MNFQINNFQKLFILAIIFFGFFGLVKSSQAATINAVSCEQADVQTAIGAASDGDTVLVPAGSCTWTSTLAITKGLIIQGAGIGNTVITANMPNTAYLISYIPANPDLNEAFRITGFTFDLDSVSPALYMYNGTTAYPVNKVRIDHNNFVNCQWTPKATWLIEGTVYGVADNNTFTGAVHFDNMGLEVSSWSNLTFTYGTADNFYYEDNVFNTDQTMDSGGHGGRYSNRYNTYNLLANLYPLFDAHGNQPSGVHATMGVEIYGNLVDGGSFNAVPVLGQRGGKALLFGNKIITTGLASCSIWEEYDDSISPPAINPINGEPQHVNDSYYWNNRKNSALFNTSNLVATGTVTNGSNNYLDDSEANFNFCATGCFAYGVKIISGTGSGQFRQLDGITTTRLMTKTNWDTNPDNTSQYQVLHDCCNVVLENREFFNQSTSFDGTIGMGCGTLAARPATCVTGVGYWATNQSCSSVDSANVGAHPATPISGTLYKCTATNTWTAYYTPYTYPYPLRTDCINYPTLCDSDTTPPAAPSGLSVN